MTVHHQKSEKYNLTSKDIAFKGVGDLIKLLPTGTVFLFHFLNPLLTNVGHCTAVNRHLSIALLVVCGFSCFFSSFTDSYVGRDGKVYYGIVTRSGLWAFSDPSPSSIADLERYKLQLGDFAHAFVSLLVFAVIALSDGNTMNCLYPSFKIEEQAMLMALATVVGGVASSVFVIFPDNRPWHWLTLRRIRTQTIDPADSAKYKKVLLLVLKRDGLSRLTHNRGKS